MNRHTCTEGHSSYSAARELTDPTCPVITNSTGDTQTDRCGQPTSLAACQASRQHHPSWETDNGCAMCRTETPDQAAALNRDERHALILAGFEATARQAKSVAQTRTVAPTCHLPKALI